MRERWVRFALFALVVQIPFELKYTFLGLSNLQWTFIALAALSAGDLLRQRRKLSADRLVQAAALFVAIQWMAAAWAPDFNVNAMKAAARFTAGLMLLSIVRLRADGEKVLNCWSHTAVFAALAALAGSVDLGLPWLFRDQEHYIGQVQRLSGTFEYPNIAAAYYAMSLPIVWWRFGGAAQWAAAIALWGALLLTYSRSAIAALLVVLAGALTFTRRPLALAAAGMLAVMLLLPWNDHFADVFRRTSRTEPLKAEYRSVWNTLSQQPDVDDEIRLIIRNTGTFQWPAEGRSRVAVSYRWLRQDSRLFLRNPGVVTPLPRDVQPGQTIELVAAIRTPVLPGKYVLAVELFSRDYDWFSRTGVPPLLIETDIHSGNSRQTRETDLSHWYRSGQDSGLNVTAAVSRKELWQAALKMFGDYPFGVGPDNFRLQYGKYLGAMHWDTNIYANSLYLELLTGVGLLGFAAFWLMLSRVTWQAAPHHFALAVFLVHGIADVFIMATPIYFSFWFLLGCKTPRLS